MNREINSRDAETVASAISCRFGFVARAGAVCRILEDFAAVLKIFAATPAHRLGRIGERF